MLNFQRHPKAKFSHPQSISDRKFHPAAMPYKKLPRKFWADLQKLTVNSLPAGLFAIESLSLSLAVVAAVAAVPATLEPANASTVTSWKFDPATNQLEITLPEGTTPKYSLLNPSQIAVDLPNTEIGVDATQLYPQGRVRSVEVSQLQPGTARILINLAPGVGFSAGKVHSKEAGKIAGCCVLRSNRLQLGKLPKLNLSLEYKYRKTSRRQIPTQLLPQRSIELSLLLP